MSTVGKAPNGVEFNLDQLTTNLSTDLEAALRDVIEGTQEDIRQFVGAIARDMANIAAAPATKQEELLKECVNQLRVVGETARVRAVNEGWELVSKVITTVSNVVLSALLSVKV